MHVTNAMVAARAKPLFLTRKDRDNLLIHKLQVMNRVKTKKVPGLTLVV
jgi:hypothetical protein